VSIGAPFNTKRRPRVKGRRLVFSRDMDLLRRRSRPGALEAARGWAVDLVPLSGPTFPMKHDELLCEAAASFEDLTAERPG